MEIFPRGMLPDWGPAPAARQDGVGADRDGPGRGHPARMAPIRRTSSRAMTGTQELALSDAPAAPPAAPASDTTPVTLPSRPFLVGCTFVATGLLVLGRATTLPLLLLATEVLVTILGLFLFGSFKYQIHKNALTYGMLLINITT